MSNTTCDLIKELGLEIKERGIERPIRLSLETDSPSSLGRLFSPVGLPTGGKPDIGRVPETAEEPSNQSSLRSKNTPVDAPSKIPENDRDLPNRKRKTTNDERNSWLLFGRRTNNDYPLEFDPASTNYPLPNAQTLITPEQGKQLTSQYSTYRIGYTTIMQNGLGLFSVVIRRYDFTGKDFTWGKTNQTDDLSYRNVANLSDLFLNHVYQIYYTLQYQNQYGEQKTADYQDGGENTVYSDIEGNIYQSIGNPYNNPNTRINTRLSSIRNLADNPTPKPLPNFPIFPERDGEIKFKPAFKPNTPNIKPANPAPLSPPLKTPAQQPEKTPEKPSSKPKPNPLNPTPKKPSVTPDASGTAPKVIPKSASKSGTDSLKRTDDESEATPKSKTKTPSKPKFKEKTKVSNPIVIPEIVPDRPALDIKPSATGGISIQPKAPPLIPDVIDAEIIEKPKVTGRTGVKAGVGDLNLKPNKGNGWQPVNQVPDLLDDTTDYVEDDDGNFQFKKKPEEPTQKGKPTACEKSASCQARSIPPLLKESAKSNIAPLLTGVAGDALILEEIGDIKEQIDEQNKCAKNNTGIIVNLLLWILSIVSYMLGLMKFNWLKDVKDDIKDLFKEYSICYIENNEEKELKGEEIYGLKQTGDFIDNKLIKVSKVDLEKRLFSKQITKKDVIEG